MNNIEKILNEIYLIDPSLKERENEVRKIIQNLLESRPAVRIDENFVEDLRVRLQSSARLAGLGPVRRSFWAGIFQPRKADLVLAGAFVSVLVVLTVLPLVRQSGLPPVGPGDIVAVDENKTVTKDDGGIIVKDSSDKKKIIAGFTKFKSEAEFKDYLAVAETGYGGWGGAVFQGRGAAEMGISMDAKTTAPSSLDFAEPERFSETNVQVKGIDEPDIVKTNGREIYFSSQGYYARPMPIMFEVEPTEIGGTGILPPEYNQPDTKVIKAFPPADLSEKSSIKKNGNLLLKDNTLVVLENNDLFGYDVANPDSPKEKWSVDLKERSSIVQARLYGEKIYLVTSTWTDRVKPCPLPLLTQGEKSISIDCLEIYHPQLPVPVNAVYSISTVDITTGRTTKGISFVGSYDSVVYMSKNALYIAYSYQGNQFELHYNFFKENSDLAPAWFMERLAKVQSYDLNPQTKMTEFNTIMDELRQSLDEDDFLKFDNDMENRMSEYLKKHKRDLIKTDIIKVGVDNLEVKTLGTVPGKLLNQFSLDEHEKNLRTAVTVGENFWWGGWGGWGAGVESENDVYVLDGNLKIIGSAKSLGAGERIYSARFIGDKGYLVTFRQTDPFYVLDLSDPRDPQVKGELKIPGYSSYLDPIAENRILGIGKEGSEVKISLFDVSSASNPQEVSKYILKEYWSDILNTHHAFLADAKHKIFFLPGSSGGYVFSYANDSLKLEKAVSNIQAKRALFIDDYLYIVGDNKIVVLNETDWETVKELNF